MLNTSGPLFGRKKEVDNLCNVVNQSKKSVTCIVGEAGIGKSALLRGLYNELEKRDTDFLLGFYDKDSSLWGESQSPNHPFVTILVNLIEWAKNRQHMDFKKRAEYTFVERIKNVKKFAPDLFSAFVGDIASKVGFEKTVNVAVDIVKKIRGTAIDDARNYVSQHSNEAVFYYIEVIESLLSQFKDRTLVLIFDDFETARKASVDFMRNFITHMPEDSNLHVILSFSVEQKKWSDTIARELFVYFNEYLEDIGEKPLKLDGLSPEGIGEWIRSYEKDVDQLKLNLIRRYSAGFPSILEQWIPHFDPQTFDPAEIDINRLCSYIHKRREGLNERDNKVLDKLVILAQNPITIKQFTQDADKFEAFIEFLEIGHGDYKIFREKLVNVGFFDSNETSYPWFKHDVIKKCLDKELRRPDNIPDYTRYQEDATKLCEKVLRRISNRDGH